MSSTDNSTAQRERFNAATHGNEMERAIMRIRALSDLMQMMPEDIQLADRTMSDTAAEIYSSIREIERLHELLLNDWREARRFSSC